jgi:hypothetical protein
MEKANVYGRVSGVPLWLREPASNRWCQRTVCMPWRILIYENENVKINIENKIFNMPFCEIFEWVFR